MAQDGEVATWFQSLSVLSHLFSRSSSRRDGRRHDRGPFLGVGVVLLFVVALGSYAVAQTCVQPPPGLVSWWPGDGNAKDIADGNPGTLQGGVTFASGKVGQAFHFNGVDGAV